LPLFDPLRLVGVPENVIDVFEPFTTELVEAGYDRSIPFGEPTPAQLIPVIDPVTLTLRLTRAVLEGANNAVKLIGGELPGYTALAGQLDALVSTSAATIGVPYRDAVRSINESFNPILAFNDIERPLVEPINSAANATGIPKLLSDVVGSALYPLTAWGERNVLFPQADSDEGGPIAGLARQFLKSVAPHLGATDSDGEETSTDSTVSTATAKATTPATTRSTGKQEHRDDPDTVDAMTDSVDASDSDRSTSSDGDPDHESPAAAATTGSPGASSGDGDAASSVTSNGVASDNAASSDKAASNGVASDKAASDDKATSSGRDADAA
jgi:hypothetical protein